MAKSFTEGPSIPQHGTAAVPAIYAANPHVFCVATKATNGNVVVYEALLNASRQLADIDMYWLDLDPAYRGKRAHLRDRCNVMDRKFYGLKVMRRISPTHWEVAFKQLPARLLQLQVLPGAVRLFTTVNNIPHCKLHHLRIRDEPAFMGLLPRVTHITLVAAKDKKRITEVIQR
jgi:hypothetical protein